MHIASNATPASQSVQYGVWAPSKFTSPVYSHVTLHCSHLPVRSLMFQCPICMHGGHQDCYREYYSRRPPDEGPLPAVPQAIRAGRSSEVGTPRGRALSRTNSAYTVDEESDDGLSTQGDGEGTTESWGSGRGMAVSSSDMILGRLCAAGCGHHCWAAEDRKYPV